MRRSQTSRALKPIDSADCASSRDYIQAAFGSIDSACKAAVVLCNRDGSLTRMDVLRRFSLRVGSPGARCLGSGRKTRARSRRVADRERSRYDYGAELLRGIAVCWRRQRRVARARQTVTLASSRGERQRGNMRRRRRNLPMPVSRPCAAGRRNPACPRYARVDGLHDPALAHRVLCTLGQRLLCTPADLVVSRLRGMVCPFSPSAKRL